MNQTILFTPVGGTDPISLNNYHDGSILHICRFYKPDKVILYMSKEMLDFQEKDDRYRYCLDRLAKMQNRSMVYEIIERRKLTRVHEFDYFYEDFRKVISCIYETMDESDTLLLNVSSGTPAMKSGLLVLQTLGEFPAKVIQVATPVGKLNEQVHEGYDVETLWELDEENQEGAQNRCKEIQCPTLSKIKKEEIIKKHILVYDYQAALDVADSLLAEQTVQYRDLIYQAARRVLLDFANVDKTIQKTKFQCLPVRSSSQRKYFEYALTIDIRLKRGEYVDFIRSITPIVVDLFEMILKKQCGIIVDDYCEQYKRAGQWKRMWSAKKLNGTEVGKVLNSHYQKMGKRFEAKDVYSEHLKILTDHFSSDTHLKQLMEDLRNVESNIRNLAAHEIVSVTDETIKNLTGFYGRDIMSKIRELFGYTEISIRKEYWDSYDEMNRKILEQMSNE